MPDEKIRVEFEHKAFIGGGEAGFVVIIRMKKDDFETTIEIPVGDEVSSKEFALAAKVLYEASLMFHHRVYDRLREDRNRKHRSEVLRRKSLALFEKDQRGG